MGCEGGVLWGVREPMEYEDEGTHGVSGRGPIGCEAGAPQVVREGSHGVGWMFEGWRPTGCEAPAAATSTSQVGSRGVPWGPVEWDGGVL